MFRIYDGRDTFYQWDLNQKLIVDDISVNEVHFCTRACSEALVVEVYELDGLRVADVPNILLQKSFDLKAYAYCGDGYTIREEYFEIIERTKPTDYIYTETEVKRFEVLEAQLAEVKEVTAGIKKRYVLPHCNSVAMGTMRTSTTKVAILMIIYTKSHDGSYEMDIPFEYTDNPPEHNPSYITNINDFKPMIKNSLIGDGVYSFDDINRMLDGMYYGVDYACIGQDTEIGYSAFMINEYRFANSDIAEEFMNEISPIMKETEYIVLEHEKPLEVFVEPYQDINATILEVE